MNPELGEVRAFVRYLSDNTESRLQQLEGSTMDIFDLSEFVAGGDEVVTMEIQWNSLL